MKNGTDDIVYYFQVLEYTSVTHLELWGNSVELESFKISGVGIYMSATQLIVRNFNLNVWTQLQVFFNSFVMLDKWTWTPEA